jgi:hypothetical protein
MAQIPKNKSPAKNERQRISRLFEPMLTGGAG